MNFCRTKLLHHESLMAQVERERAENTQLKSRMHQIETQYNSYVSSEHELAEFNEQLRADCQDLREQLRKAQDDIDSHSNRHEEVLIQHKASWASEKCHLQQRIDELEGQLSDQRSKLNVYVTAHKTVEYTAVNPHEYSDIVICWPQGHFSA